MSIFFCLLRSDGRRTLRWENLQGSFIPGGGECLHFSLPFSKSSSLFPVLKDRHNKSMLFCYRTLLKMAFNFISLHKEYNILSLTCFLVVWQCFLGPVLCCSREKRHMWTLQWSQGLPWLCESIYKFELIVLHWCVPPIYLCINCES